MWGVRSPLIGSTLTRRTAGPIPEPIVFDSYDITPVLFGTDENPRNSWFYFIGTELTPGAARIGNYKTVFNLRGDNGLETGGLAVDMMRDWSTVDPPSNA